MKLRLAGPLLAAALSAGCATTEPTCYQYPKKDFKVCQANSAVLGKICDQRGLKDASFLSADSKRYYGCADRANKVAWVALDGPQPESTIHTICFMLNEKAEDCEKIRRTPAR